MKKLLKACFLAISLMFPISTSTTLAAQVVIAGSELNAPPAFWDHSYYPLSQWIDRAFPFTAIPGGTYQVESLQIAAFHHPGFAGSHAYFSLHEDSQGLPGAELTNFQTHSISAIAEVHALVPSKYTTLESDTLYWIIGQTLRGAVNWNLSDSKFGQTAFRRPNVPWTVQKGRNLAAFAILGTPIPEPSSMPHLGFVALGVVCFHKRRHQTLR